MTESLYTTIIDSSAPTTSTIGVVGQWYIDTSASPADLYLCTDATGGVYTWTKQGGGGGTVDQTYDPTSTNAQSGVAVASAISSAITTALNTPV